MTFPIDGDLYVTGKTGLGIEQPQERLEVNGKIKTTDLQASGTVQALTFQGDGSNLTGVVKNLDLAVKKAGDTMTGPLTIQNNLTVTGNVGIATTAAPSERLEVNGNVKATSFLGDGSKLTGVVKNLDLAVKKAGDTMTGALTIQNSLTVNGNLSITGVIQRGGDPITTTADLGLYSQLDGQWMRFVTKNAPFRFFSDGGAGTNPIFTIDAGGNINAGGTVKINQGTQSSFGGHLYLSKIDGSPGRGQWHINIAPNNALNFVETGIADYRLAITPGGNVGIGTNNPQQKLHLNGGNFTITNNGNTFTISVEGNRVVFYLSNAYHGTNKRISWDGDNNWDQA